MVADAGLETCLKASAKRNGMRRTASTDERDDNMRASWWVRLRWFLFASAATVLLYGCAGRPKGIEPVQGFDIDRYLGKWYEIARLDHSFERGLSHVTAEYSRRVDGGVRVINRGYSSADGTWDEAEGKAYFVDNDSEGYLKVSFFGPFYGAYVVFALDKRDYQYAFIAGNDRSYLWLLARAPQVDEAVKTRFVSEAKALGFDTDALIFVDQKDPPPMD